MRRVAWVVVALAAACAGGASAAGPPWIAFTAGDPADRTDVVLVNPEGTTVMNLTPSPLEDDLSPSWSPDGARLVFVSRRDGRETQDLYVMNADGSGARRLTTDSTNLDPAWSPDGARIAWRKVRGAGDEELWVTSPDGSGKRQLLPGEGRLTAPQWSRDGTRLLLARAIETRTEVLVIDAASAAVRVLTPAGASDTTPRWSPDGAQIAFVSADAIWVMRTDGTLRRQVSATRGLGPAWSPDGTRIAFTGIRLFPELGIGRFGPPTRNDVHVVRVDGSDERRLTGPLDAGYSSEPTSGAPSWWPDGSRLFFTSARSAAEAGGALYVMNADGSCERRFASSAPRLFGPAWRPGSTPLPAPLACAGLRLRVGAPTDAVGIGQNAIYRLVIENDGNRLAARPTLTLRTSGAARLSPRFVSRGCETLQPTTTVCTLDPLEPGRRLELQVAGRSPRAGAIEATFRLDAAEEDGDASNDEVRVRTTVLSCTLVGTLGHDALVGTAKRDRICARAGWDRINALAGNDDIDAGNGSDTVDAGKGRDAVLGSGGADVILVRDGERDTVDCGTETDVVLADRLDVVARNCEQVIRA